MRFVVVLLFAASPVFAAPGSHAAVSWKTARKVNRTLARQVKKEGKWHEDGLIQFSGHFFNYDKTTKQLHHLDAYEEAFLAKIDSVNNLVVTGTLPEESTKEKPLSKQEKKAVIDVLPSLELMYGPKAATTLLELLQ